MSTVTRVLRKGKRKLTAAALAVALLLSAVTLPPARRTRAGDETPFWTQDYMPLDAWDTPASAEMTVEAGNGLRSFDNGIYCMDATSGLGRTDADPRSLYYEFTEDIGKVTVYALVVGGIDGYNWETVKKDFDIEVGPGASTYSVVGKANTGENGTETGFWGTLAQGGGAIVEFYTTGTIDPDCRFLKITMRGTELPYLLTIAGVEVYGKETGGVVNVESVSIDNEVFTFESGASLTCAASRLPEDASFTAITWAAYDDAECEIPSVAAFFNGAVLSADFDGADGKEVWIVATCGGVDSEPVKITVARKPDVSSVAIAIPEDTSVLEDDTLNLSATVSPANANNKTVVWKVYTAADCATETAAETASIDGNGVFTAGALSSGNSLDVYARAEVATVVGEGWVYSLPVKLTIVKMRVLLNDPCTDTTKITEGTRDGVVPKQGMLNRSFAEGDMDDNYGALGPAAATDPDRAAYDAHYVDYFVYGDIGRYDADVVIYDQAKGAGNPDNKQYFGYLIEVYLSADGEDWAYCPSDYSFIGYSDQIAGVPIDHSKVRFYNRNEIPEGMRYMRIYLIGQIRLQGAGSAYSGAPLSERGAGYEFDKIELYYNVYSPFLAGARIMSDPNADIDEAVTAVEIRNEVKNIRKGTPFELEIYRELSTDVGNFEALSDFSGVTYQIISGGGFVNIEDGSNVIAVKPDFSAPGRTETLKLKAVLGGTESVEYTFNLITPVEAVTVSTQNGVSATIQRGTTVAHYLTLAATVSPADATPSGAAWSILTGPALHTGEFSGSRFRANTEGVYTVRATVDGVQSEPFTVTVVAQATLTDNLEVKTVAPDGRLTLTAGIAPDALNYLAVKWEIVEGGEFAELDGAVLIGKAVGTVKVKGSVVGSPSVVEYTVEVKEETAAQPDKGCGGCGGVASGGGNWNLPGAVLLLLAAAGVATGRKRKFAV
ncbi:MAG: Ig-like domain-containing protein [Clostridiales bacterium]|jgi:uncharacterized protein YjdB|nr:Ig-like domain-containing protein [Clostridiales bacterium]